MKIVLKVWFPVVILLLLNKSQISQCTTDHRRPNIVIFLADDMGYGDLSSYGHPTQEWGAIDDLAKEGMRLTSLYATSSICSPSRAALLTGRLPVRTGVYGDGMVFLPTSPTGLPHEEITLAEALKDTGYSTGMVGKWHLGVNSYTPMDGAFLPYRQGFDYVGTNLPLTNHWTCEEHKIHMDHPGPSWCALYYNTTIIQQPFSHENLTRSFVDDAKRFIRLHRSHIAKPFFLYVSFAHQHTSLFSSSHFKGSSERGIYGDNLREMSWGVGEIMSEIRRMGLDEDTLVLFTSDHGGHMELCNEGGDNGIFRGGKNTYFEGGIRVPGILRWPRHVPPGIVNKQVISLLDMFPTFVKLAGGNIPTDRVIDGQDVRKLLFLSPPEHEPDVHKPNGISKAQTKRSTHATTVLELLLLLVDLDSQCEASDHHHSSLSNQRALFFYCNDILFAVRYGNFKIHFRSKPTKSKFENAAASGEGGFPETTRFDCFDCDAPCAEKHNPPLLFNVAADPGEVYPLDPTLNSNILKEIERIVIIHELKLEKGPPLLDVSSGSSVPCCDSSKQDCSCNYP